MKRCLTLVAYLLPWCAAPAAAAAPPPDESPAAVAEPEGSVELAALLGYGFGGDLGSGDNNMFGTSYGLQAGYVFPSNVYLGGTLLRYLGPNDDVYEYDTFTLDCDLGYAFDAGPFRLRPSLGLGVLLSIIESDDGAGSGLGMQVVPALQAQYSLGVVRFGADARYALAGSYPHVFAVLGSVGVGF